MVLNLLMADACFARFVLSWHVHEILSGSSADDEVCNLACMLFFFPLSLFLSLLSHSTRVHFLCEYRETMRVRESVCIYLSISLSLSVCASVCVYLCVCECVSGSVCV
jgi:hypothetical protein